MAPSTQLDPQGSRLGSLLSKYTSWKRSQISFWEVRYPTIWMAGTSASALGLGRVHQQPQQINLYTSFCASSVASINILWRMRGRCRDPTSHLGYSSKNSSASRWCSAFQTGSPSSLAHSLAVRDLCNLSPKHSSTSAWYLKQQQKHYTTYD